MYEKHCVVCITQHISSGRGPIEDHRSNEKKGTCSFLASHGALVTQARIKDNTVDVENGKGNLTCGEGTTLCVKLTLARP